MVRKQFAVWKMVRAWAVAALMATSGCQANAEKSDPQFAAGPRPAHSGQVAKLTLTSSAFAEGAPIPKKYTGEGDDVSPPLSWSGLPTGTKELALVCDDPDASPTEPWVHWVIYDIPAGVAGLREGVEKKPQPLEPGGAAQGKNSWPSDNIGYRGPKPPPGKPHRYYFALYALDAKLSLPAGLNKKALFEAMNDHVIGDGRLMGTFQR
jgi:Raf kinase inhibitor-like YbhB/YbcL family protein